VSIEKQDRDSPQESSVGLETRVAEVVSAEEEEEEFVPLTPEAFEKALSEVDALGLTWTADRSPIVKPKTAEAEGALIGERFEELQDRYPHLPFEVFLATSHYLTGSEAFAQVAGGEESLKRKAEIAARFIIDHDYRTEFFFRSAIKVPYLRDVDWEVVTKLYERGVRDKVNISYGLLALSFQDPFNTGKGRPPIRHFTVAVDEMLVNSLLEALTELKSRLVSARTETETLSQQQPLEERHVPQE
jgi:hypothetical protein